MQRGKLALELTQAFSAKLRGSEMAVVLEGGMRYDDGDGVNGASAEVGGGLRYTNSGLGADRGGPRPVRHLGARRLRGMGHGRLAHVRPGDPRPGALDPGGAVVRQPR